MSKVKCVKIEPNNELNKKLYETFLSPLRHGFGEFGDENTVLPISYEEIADECENFEVKNSDVFVASYPKTGTTWTQEMVWMIVNNLDFERGKIRLPARFPYLEISGLFNYTDVTKNDPNSQTTPTVVNSVKRINESTESPRLIKTHFPWSLMPKQIRTKEKTPKIIYVTRNVKDTCVSYYYHAILIDGYSGDFETFYKLFIAGRVLYGDFWKHLNGFYQKRNEPNILIIQYEDMKNNLSDVIRKVAAFLDKTLTDDQIDTLTKHLSFEIMKNNPAVNYSDLSFRKHYNNNADGGKFMRSGTVGSYKKDMSPEIEKVFDEWIEKCIEETGIKL